MKEFVSGEYKDVGRDGRRWRRRGSDQTSNEMTELRKYSIVMEGKTDTDEENN